MSDEEPKFKLVEDRGDYIERCMCQVTKQLDV